MRVIVVALVAAAVFASLLLLNFGALVWLTWRAMLGRYGANLQGVAIVGTAIVVVCVGITVLHRRRRRPVSRARAKSHQGSAATGAQTPSRRAPRSASAREKASGQNRARSRD